MNINRTLILASKSPRRQQLLREAGFEFEVLTREVDESFPRETDVRHVAAYLSRKKAEAFDINLTGKVLLTADTTVIVADRLLEKPADRQNAADMLTMLSGRPHRVITAFTLKDDRLLRTTSCETRVYFRKLTEQEIDFYIEKYQPFDKAGAYGIQEWIGMVGIEKIEGSYFNVVGLPVDKVYSELISYFA